MKRLLIVVLLALLSHGCGVEPEVGRRFEAERDLWRADWQSQKLSVRPGRIDAGEWAGLAGEYEAVADRFLGATSATDLSRTDLEIQQVTARALFRAAQIYSQLRDSVRAEQIYQRMQESFDHLPNVAAEVELTRGAIAERGGRLREAAGYYQSAVSRLEPRLDQTGPASRILQLPLHIARLYSRSETNGEQQADEQYRAAVDYYELQAAEHAGTPLEIEAEAMLASVAADRGEWEEASRLLTQVETQLNEAESPHRDPAEVRLLLAEAQNQAGVELEATREILLSLLEDYPDSDIIPSALLSLANNATQREETDEALSYLERLRTEHPDEERISSEALLAIARLLARDDRWPEALESYRRLTVEHPISVAALTAPLEIAQYHASKGDEDAAGAALERAEREYRDFIERYPPGQQTLKARERLIETLVRRADLGTAVSEMERLGEIAVGNQLGYNSLMSAARMAVADLGDTSRAVGILERIGELYPGATWAGDEAERLRGTAQP